MNWMRITTSIAALAIATAALCVPAFGQVPVLDPTSGDDGNVPVTIGTIKVKGNSDQTGEKGITVPGTGNGTAEAGPTPGIGGILQVSCIGGVLGGGSTNAGLGASLGECDAGGGSGSGPGDGDGDGGNGDGGNGDGGTVVPDLPPPLDCLDIALEPTPALDLTCDGDGGTGVPTRPRNSGDDDNADGAGSTGAGGGNGDGDGSATSCIDQAANVGGTSGKGPLLGGLALGLVMFALGALSRRRRGIAEAV